MKNCWTESGSGSTNPGNVALEWRIWLATEGNDRDTERDELSDNTVRRRTGLAKQSFRATLTKRLIKANPFSGLTAQVRGNRKRQQFVTREDEAESQVFPGVAEPCENLQLAGMGVRD